MAAAEVVLTADPRVGYRLPEELRGGLDVDLIDLFHGSLQVVFDAAELGDPRLGVLAHPAVVDEPDWDGIQEMQLLAAAAPGHDQASLLQLPEVLHDAESGHRQAPLESAQGLTVLPEELVPQTPPGWVSEGLESVVHGHHYR